MAFRMTYTRGNENSQSNLSSLVTFLHKYTVGAARRCEVVFALHLQFRRYSRSVAFLYEDHDRVTAPFH